MKRVVSFLTFCAFAVLGFMMARDSPLIKSALDRWLPVKLPGLEPAPVATASPGKGARKRVWTFNDGTSLEAALIAADGEKAQLRVPQGVGQIELALFSEPDRHHIQSWIAAEGINGVAGLPINLKTHRWPQQWRDHSKVPLTRVGDTMVWRSQHFEITDEAKLKPEALESIVMICEAVDGAMSSLPLPFPIHWGREPGELRKIIIKSIKNHPGEHRAGYWDGRTGIVHIYAEALLEPDLQLVVFEFNKPEKVQKYDVIVHEITHQSMAALLYMKVPAWVGEGMAEYMAATHFAPAYYEFSNTHVSVRHHINKRLLGDRIVKERRLNSTRLEKMMNRDIFEWNHISATEEIAGFLQYHEALMLVDYFAHRDHPDGLHFRRYLESILSGVPEPEAQERHLLRGRSYAEIEEHMRKLWQPLGFAINFQDHSELRAGDVAINWDAEEVKKTIASRRAMMED